MRDIQIPVDCISVISSSGQITPLRFRLEQENQERLRVNIDQVVSVRDIPYVGVEAQIFLCRARVEGYEWLFELKYTFGRHCWHLLRRLH